MSKADVRLIFTELGVLFFIQGMAFAMWMVPLTLVLIAHGLNGIQPFAFATTAIGAFLSPLSFGALADRHLGPTRVLRGLCFASAGTMASVGFAIHLHWNAWFVLAVIQLFALCVTPTASLTTAIAMSRLNNPQRQFGPIRAMGTIGWMVGCWIISVMHADAKTLALFTGAGLWLVLGVFAWRLPNIAPPASTHLRTLGERLGLDALTLLKKKDHRVVFLTATLFTIPLAAFYPYTPPHLRDIGFESPSAWMSVGQTTEILAMFGLGALLTRWRLKWILGIGLMCGVLRYAFCAINRPAWLLAGIALHGLTYTLFFTTAQIYVNERVDPAWRARGQALLTLLLAGVGSLAGYLGCGWWFAFNTGDSGTTWTRYWGGLAAVVGLVMIYFFSSYRGRGWSAVQSQSPSSTHPSAAGQS